MYATAGRGRQRTSGKVSHSGATTNVANFVHAESATKTPRAHGDVTSQKPQIKNAAGIASFVFELETYCVNGYAAHANGSSAPSNAPPKRKPTSASPMTHATSNAIDVKCTAGSSLFHLPDQPKSP
jgi:hypothetical protein